MSMTHSEKVGRDLITELRVLATRPGMRTYTECLELRLTALRAAFLLEEWVEIIKESPHVH